MEYIEIIVATIFVNNILLAQFLGNCPFLGTSKKMETALGMSMAVIFVLVLAGVITWVIFEYLLEPYKLVYLRTIAFILVIASLVQFVEMFLKKSIPALYSGLGIFLPFITTNCAVLATATEATAVIAMLGVLLVRSPEPEAGLPPNPRQRGPIRTPRRGSH